jgi:hypothetical protein
VLFVHGHRPGYFALVTVSQALAAASIASMPVRSVGVITGANSGEWFDGSSFRLPVLSASANFFGSMPPTNQYTEGAWNRALVNVLKVWADRRVGEPLSP